jgi:excisionase family DNA binding protein
MFTTPPPTSSAGPISSSATPAASGSPAKTDSPRRTLSIMQTCAEIGVSRRTIYNWISAGKLEYKRTPGGSIRIFADTLLR